MTELQGWMKAKRRLSLAIVILSALIIAYTILAAIERLGP